MSDSEDDDTPKDKVRKTLLSQRGRQGSRLNFKGVKSYLHQFYEYATDGDKNSGDTQCYIKTRKIRVRSAWWKVTLGCGMFLMALGGMGALISFVVPRKPVLVDEEEDFAVMDKEAVEFNKNLDLLKLASVITFCVGGICSSLALLLASCCWRCCTNFELKYDDVEPLHVAKKLVDEGDYEDVPPGSPIERKVPGSGAVVNVQPVAGFSGGSTAAAAGDKPYPVPIITTTSTVD